MIWARCYCSRNAKRPQCGRFFYRLQHVSTSCNNSQQSSTKRLLAPIISIQVLARYRCRTRVEDPEPWIAMRAIALARCPARPAMSESLLVALAAGRPPGSAAHAQRRGRLANDSHVFAERRSADPQSSSPLRACPADFRIGKCCRVL